MAQTDYKFEGWMGLDATSAEGNMVWQEFEPKEWEETDIDIKVSHCGICGSDLHTLRSGWVSNRYFFAVFTVVQLTDLEYSALPHTLAASDTKSLAPPCASDRR